MIQLSLCNGHTALTLFRPLVWNTQFRIMLIVRKGICFSMAKPD